FYVVPYLWHSITVDGGQRVSDLYVANALTKNWLPFTEFTPIGLLELTGLAGLVIYAGTSWWARPMLVIVVGAYVYRLAGLVSFLSTGHTMFSHYTVKVVGVTLAAAGVLTVAEVGPRVLSFVSRHAPPRRVGAAALVVFLLWSGYRYWDWAMPSGDQRSTAAPIAGGNPTLDSDYATLAHAEPLPYGGLPRYHPVARFRGYFPAGPVATEVAKRRGAGARPMTLSYDERLYAYYPWPGYLPPGREATNTLANYDDRLSELHRLGAIRDPEEFARSSRSTRYGGIDVFVLKAKDDGRWHTYKAAFRPEQFDSPAFDVVRLANSTVVAVRVK
ncbi:MAG: arabinofuranosyltransferase, partial [Stackebrandtia sp.]